MLLAITVSSTLDNVLQFIGLLLLFVFILGATYFTTRWIANYQRTTGLNRNIKVIETYKLTTNKYIQIIQLGEKNTCYFRDQGSDRGSCRT
jgi:flagellar protein FliO/FliZ